MKTSEVDILIVPGWSGSGPEHWQIRWLNNLSTARLVEQDDWLKPDRAAWTQRIARSVNAATDPVVIVAHSLGVIATIHTVAHMQAKKVAGAFLVAPADVDNATAWPVTHGHTFSGKSAAFSPIPLQTLPFPATLIASTSDPYCTLARARTFAENWGATFVDAGDVGHINVASGHGPWPDGLLRFGKFLKHLGPA